MTIVYGAMLRVIQADEPMTEWWPMIGLATQDRGIGVDDHAVADGRVPLGVADDLAGLLVAGEAEGAQRHSLVKLDSLADLGRLADDDAGAVIDEEPPADRGAGMDIDAGLAVCVLGHHPGDQRNVETIKLVSHAINGDGRQAGVAKDDLVGALGGRVAVKRGLHVFGQSVAQLGQRLQEADHDRLRLGFEIGLAVLRVAIVAECAGDLLA